MTARGSSTSAHRPRSTGPDSQDPTNGGIQMDEATVLTTNNDKPFSPRNLLLARAWSYAQPDRILVERDRGLHQVSPTRNGEQPVHLLKEVGHGIWKPAMQWSCDPTTWARTCPSGGPAAAIGRRTEKRVPVRSTAFRMASTAVGSYCPASLGPRQAVACLCIPREPGFIKPAKPKTVTFLKGVVWLCY